MNHHLESFSSRHIGIDPEHIQTMLKSLELASLDELTEKVLPPSIRNKAKYKKKNFQEIKKGKGHPGSPPLDLVSEKESLEGLSEFSFLKQARKWAQKNKVFKSYIGQGYYESHTPSVIQRNILENPKWYTSYTPYQAEISQGRMEALFNFQTMISDLTGMEISNASLLDEGSAAAEAMMMAFRIQNQKSSTSSRFFVDKDSFPQTIEILLSRAEPLGIEVVIGNVEEWENKNISQEAFFGSFFQYPFRSGKLLSFSAYQKFSEKIHSQKGLVVVAADLLSLCLLQSPGSWGSDIVVGSSQRFGLPLSFGGPHAGFLSCQKKYQRFVPGRIIGLSKDSEGKPALRLALQTREQHIRREHATSNICTAQALPAIMASMYAVYQGPNILRQTALRVHSWTHFLSSFLRQNLDIQNLSPFFFDTLLLSLGQKRNALLKKAYENKILFFPFKEDQLYLSLDETTTFQDVKDLILLFIEVFASNFSPLQSQSLKKELNKNLKQHQQALEKRQDSTNLASFADHSDLLSLPPCLLRQTKYLTHSVFNSFHSETEMLRYISRLEAKDLSLAHSMIPLGSCTMKLNATTEMIPITWPELSAIHPFAPPSTALGYLSMMQDLEQKLCHLTGFSALSLQPNAGSQGEYTGLLIIRKYYQEKGEPQRNVCLIPTSAHGTNPASAAMAGFKVVSVSCDRKGNVDFKDFKEKVQTYSSELATCMITYPSTHGVFEESILDICDLMHSHGGQVYMDGANFNALVGLVSPAALGADMAHLNLHKTFCVPHGGGGPGVGPLAVASHLKHLLPSHPLLPLYDPKENQQNPSHLKTFSVSSAPWGNANVLPISWAYLKMMGERGLKKATQIAILNANYIAQRLKPHYHVLYQGETGFVAHECIIDVRSFKASAHITVEDVAKRLMDYGFHAPTMSWPVPGTLMIEPTESESLKEIDRFCESLISIREEIREIEQGKANKEKNILKNAPHSLSCVTANSWPHPYSREQAAFPKKWLKEEFKFWPSVSRIDNVHGDRNLICTCSH